MAACAFPKLQHALPVSRQKFLVNTQSGFKLGFILNAYPPQHDPSVAEQ